MTDNVNHPPHYNHGKIEVLEFIEDQKLSMHEGNVVKYVCRARHKGSEIQDLKKAQFYLERKIYLLECEKDGRPPLPPNRYKCDVQLFSLPDNFESTTLENLYRKQKKEMKTETHKSFAETNDEFKRACEKVKIAPSKRQAFKYRRKRGRAYTGK